MRASVLHTSGALVSRSASFCSWVSARGCWLALISMNARRTRRSAWPRRAAAGCVVNAVELQEPAAKVAVAGERAWVELDPRAEGGGRVVPARLEHRGLAAQVVGQHVRRLLGDGLPA